jgi:hypothetical protein
MSTGTAIRVGSDVSAVHRVVQSVARFGDRYLEPIYTEQEMSFATGSAPVRATRLPQEVSPGFIERKGDI